MWVKVIVLLLLVAAAIALFSALTSMLKGDSGDGKTVRALAWRVGFSIAVFLLLVLSMMMGWVTPHGVAPGAITQSVSQAASQPVDAGKQE